MRRAWQRFRCWWLGHRWDWWNCSRCGVDSRTIRTGRRPGWQVLLILPLVPVYAVAYWGQAGCEWLVDRIERL